MAASFPNGFLWGASTASYQVEGGIENTDWAEAAREGRVPAAGRACEFYTRYEEDFDIARGLGMNAQRFSIEWARIEPEEGKFNEHEIEHYRAVIRALKRRNMTPFVNLWHFTLPLWFYHRGGFLHPDAPKVFARYCAFVVEKLGDEADMWLTHNEPMVYALNGYLRGYWPPFEKNIPHYFAVIRGMIEAHKAAYTAMKRVRPDIKIGIAKQNTYFESNWNPVNAILADVLRAHRNFYFLNALKGYQDFIGLNHYFHKKFGQSHREKAEAKYSDMGWELHPTSLYHCLMELKRYDVPVYVSEDGLADAKDRYRTQFLKETAACLYRAVLDGVPLKGYFHWSLLDNYEWAHGFTQRFGLVEVDFATQLRTIRDSARYYEQICKSNMVDDEIVLMANHIL